MSGKLCGLCLRSYNNLKQHLTGSHAIPNKDELALLMKYGNARTTKPLDCPVCDRKNLVRLDKHLIHVHLMTSKDREPLVRDAKRQCIKKEFAALRAQNPTIPMVSWLDTNAFSEDEANKIPADEKEKEEGMALNLPLSSESEAGDGTIGVPVFASTPQQAVVDPECPETSTGVVISTSTIVDTYFPSSTLSHQPRTSGGLTSSSSGVTTASSSGLASSVSQTSSSGGPPQTCECNCHEIEARVKNLEKMVSQQLQGQPGVTTAKTPRGVPPTITPSAQKYKHVGKLGKSAHLFQRLIDDYRKFRLGAKTAAKERENARQSASHALRFCLYMAATPLPKTDLADLKFIMQTDKLRALPLYLKHQGYVPTTVRYMMNNVIQFIKHVQCSFAAESKLRPADFSKILYELKQLMSNVHKNVVIHRQKVAKKKTDEQLEVTSEVKFLKVAKVKIPKLFRLLSNDGSHGKQHCQLMGYVMGYLSILTGHRSKVLMNMTREQVLGADSWSEGKKFRILVDKHKTSGSFGQAAVWLNGTEYQWVRKLALGDCCLNKDIITHVFHTILGRAVVKPALFLHMAWADSGLKGTITFGKIRSSVSTQAKHHLTEKDRCQVATADKFYATLPRLTCQVRLPRMPQAVEEYFIRKRTSVYRMPEEQGTLQGSKDIVQAALEEAQLVCDTPQGTLMKATPPVSPVEATPKVVIPL